MWYEICEYRVRNIQRELIGDCIIVWRLYWKNKCWRHLVYSRVSYSLNLQKDKFFPSLLLQATTGCSKVGVESKGNIQECLHTEMCLEHSPFLFILPRRFNKSIFAEVFHHESIQENPIGIRVSCVHAWILNPILLALFLGIWCRLHVWTWLPSSYLLENSSLKIFLDIVYFAWNM